MVAYPDLVPAQTQPSAASSTKDLDQHSRRPGDIAPSREDGAKEDGSKNVDSPGQAGPGDAAQSTLSRKELGGGAHGEHAKADQEKELTPAEKMNRRFPQPVRVGVLIGKAVLDGDDQTLGYVHDVVRGSDGKISLIVNYSAWFGWFGHPVAVPIEVVASIGKNIAALDMPPEEFAKAATWISTDEKPISHDEMIRIAVARR
jgi:hypothetical protein